MYLPTLQTSSTLNSPRIEYVTLAWAARPYTARQPMKSSPCSETKKAPKNSQLKADRERQRSGVRKPRRQASEKTPLIQNTQGRMRPTPQVWPHLAISRSNVPKQVAASSPAITAIAKPCVLALLPRRLSSVTPKSERM